MKKYMLLSLTFVSFALHLGAATPQAALCHAPVTFTTDGFKKVSSKELTPPVVEELLKQYPTSKLAGVYKNDRGEFKLIMVLQSGTRRTVYIDMHGNWFKKK
ncbi:hypothetical protein [Maribacter sp. 2307ULW6-5]|uniref:hypothetical protein n=1 Tax=Maribacter sp. 2307ULW6-5 TaxID=3386275 RepID=UPI0039BD8B67